MPTAPEFDEKIGVFVIRQQAEIKSDTGHQPQLAIPGFTARNYEADGVVEQDGDKDKSEVGRIPPAVEKQRASDQPTDGYPVMPPPADQKKYDQRGWQENKYEKVGIK